MNEMSQSAETKKVMMKKNSFDPVYLLNNTLSAKQRLWFALAPQGNDAETCFAC